MIMTIPHVASLKPSRQTVPEPFVVPPDEVHVWRADLDVGPSALLRLRKTLSAGEQARTERFYSPVERARYTAGRGILRALLARYLGTPVGDLRFCCNANGKPVLVPGSGPEGLRFNLGKVETNFRGGSRIPAAG
jgi:4'-phosphopantetheinyl transferase